MSEHDELLQAIRKQGRAALAAQAAAEACLEAVLRLEAGAKPATSSGPPAGDEAAEGAAVLARLLPFVDALRRVVQESRALASPAPAGLRARLFGQREDPRVAALVEGVRILGAQLEATLQGLGVAIDAEVGVPVDGERHRVVEVRPPGPGAPAGTVLQIVRAGYALRGRRLREADVVAAEERR